MKKKVLKIIQIIYDILSLGFIVFVIVAMAVSPKSEGHHDNNVSEVIENKTRKNAGYTDEYGHQYYYNSTEFFNVNVLNKIVSYLIDKSSAFADFSPVSSTSISTHWAYHSNDLSSLNGTFYYYDGGILQHPLQVKWISFDKSVYGSGETPSGEEWFAVTYTLSFYTSSNLINDNRILQLTYDVATPCYNANGAEINGSLCQFVGGWGSSYINDYYFSRGVYMENDLDGTCIFHDLFKVDNQTDYVNAYNNGYNAGRAKGYDEGYIKGSSGVETNAFTAISQAFEAVSNIFSIQVLPNLPLWVLVFTPLIVAVVIVVVKLIKG